MRFHEEQRFEGTVFKLLTAALLLPMPVIVAVLFVALPEMRGVLLLALGAAAVLDVGFWLMLRRLRLVTDVGADRVDVRARPFARREFPATRIEAVEPVGSGLFRRYGIGLGNRRIVKRIGPTVGSGAEDGPGKSRIEKRITLTVGGDAGVVLTLTDGWTVVLGSKRAEELGEAIRDLLREHRPELRQQEDDRWWGREEAG